MSQFPTDETCDIAIVGSGFAGSLLAIIARRLGYSIVLIERASNPRIVIGESTTPLTNLLLEELCDRYQLAEIRSFSKWGTWQHTHPEIACGLKRGFTFYHHSLDHPDVAPDPDHTRQLLVAASPYDGIADTHWYRADFDQFLMQAARRAGVEYFDHVYLDRCTDNGQHTVLEGKRHNEPIAFRTRIVADATGPHGFLHRALHLGELPLPDMPPTQAFYSHFRGVVRLADTQSRGEAPPYPVDAAAVHHVFPGGWIWVLHFNNGVTSAGIACTDEMASRLGFAGGRQTDRSEAWNHILAHMPALRQQFSQMRAIRDFTHIPRLGFRSAQIVGPRWALLPSAAGFVDPLLSTGFPLTLLGVQRLARILEWGLDAPDLGTRFAEYAAQTDAELLAAARLITALYASMDNFTAFTALTMLYFAAVSYSETAHRLGKPELASSFLLHDHPHFGPAMEKLLGQASTVRTPEQSAQFSEEVRRAIDPINVAGLADPRRRNWYPVDLDDLRANAHKFGATREDMEHLLDRCGFHAGASVSRET